MTDLVQYSVNRAVARIALDSPGNRNALSAALMTQLEDRLAQASDDEGVRAIELTHTGGTFCAGADLTEARAGGMAEGTRRVIALLRLIVELPKPVVGSIDGHVRAGGWAWSAPATSSSPGRPARSRSPRSSSGWR